MEKKQDLNLENRLLDFRKESLKKLNTTTMRSHGKLWGMDVFSWFLPDPELITKDNLLSEVKHVIGTNDLISAFEYFQMLQGSQRVLLFTSSLENWEEDKLNFDNYLSMVQIK
jgi:hypothetical protein